VSGVRVPPPASNTLQFRRFGSASRISRSRLIRQSVEEAHHSTAFKGNTIVLKQIKLLLAEGRAVENNELSGYREVRGYATAADWVYGHGI
jgi:hypothetical protein